MATSAERIVAAEWLAVMVLLTADALAGVSVQSTSLTAITYPRGSGPPPGGWPRSAGPSKGLPSPDRYFAVMIVYLTLAALAMFGRTARPAAAFGALVALAFVLAAPPGGQSPALGAIAYFDRLMGAPPPSSSSPTTTSPGVIVA